MKEKYTNFATSTLTSPSPLTSTGLLFNVSSGQGALFPTDNFLVTIDTEILFIASRSADTFTVSIRGFDGTSATSHSVGATVQHCPAQYTFQHLWQNVPDAYNPDVPPAHVGGTPSQWDNEWENVGNWTLYPTSVPSSAVFNANTSMRSHLLLVRGTSDTQLYSAYIPFSPPASTAFAVTMKLSEGINIDANGSNTVETHLFVTDQVNPTGSPDTGNRVRIDTVLAATSSNGYIAPQVARYVRFSKDTNGTWSYTTVGNIALSVNAPVYLRITYDGSGMWRGYMGDGYVFWQITRFTMNFTIRTLGIQFAAYSGASTHSAAVDWIRVVTGNQAILYYGI